jgi:hypothetical protein
VPVGNYPSAFGKFIGPIPLTYKITPTITLSNPANITYGTALDNYQLDASASVPGSFSYNPLAGTVLGVGLGQKLSTKFTPADTANYTTASVSVLINVTKAIPKIIWDNPADIVYGTALSINQLDATSSVAGSFVYTPVAGTVLTAGTQTLQTVFTPNDTMDYNTTSASVQINVLTPVQEIQLMTTFIQSLVTSGKLNNGQANSLIVKVNDVTKKLNDGNTKAATNQLNAFINEVNADIKTGKLSSADGQTLIDGANAVINAIE